MPGFMEWLIVKGLQTANKVAAVCGDEKAKEWELEDKAAKLRFKAARRIHEYASLKHITHEEAAKELGLSVPQDLFEEMRPYDPYAGKRNTDLQLPCRNRLS